MISQNPQPSTASVVEEQNAHPSETPPTLSLRSAPGDEACPRTGGNVQRAFTYLGYVLFFVGLLMGEFVLVHDHMVSWQNTFVFYITFFYYLTELFVNLLVSCYGCMFRGASFCKDSVVRTRSQFILLTLNGLVYFVAVSMRMFLMLMVAVNIIGMVMPMLYLALFISTRLVLPAYYFELRWISPHKTIRTPASVIFLLLYVLCALIVYIKNDNVYTKSWSVLAIGVWLFAECWTFILTHMMESSMVNMGRIRCGLCWRDYGPGGYKALEVGSDADTPTNLKFLAISTYRSLLGVVLSFACICLFEIDQYSDLFEHVDVGGSVAALCLVYGVCHMIYLNYMDRFEKLGRYNFDWVLRGLLVMFAGFAVFALPCEIWQAIFIGCATICLCLYGYTIKREAERFVSPLSPSTNPTPQQTDNA